jgi:hypothetical protein
MLKNKKEQTLRKLINKAIWIEPYDGEKGHPIRDIKDINDFDRLLKKHKSELYPEDLQSLSFDTNQTYYNYKFSKDEKKIVKEERNAKE